MLGTKSALRHHVFSLWCALIFGLFVTGLLAGELEDGLAALKAKDYPLAVRLLTPAAQSGQPAAQYHLGQFYRQGQSGDKDYPEAIKWLKLSSAQNHAGAQADLASMYRLGQGTKQDYAEALRLYRLAAAQGHATGQNGLGLLYHNGQGVSKNYPEALKWHGLSAAQGHMDGEANLGIMYEKGHGVAQDLREAARWYSLAAAKGNAYAKQRMASETFAPLLAQLRANPAAPTVRETTPTVPPSGQPFAQPSAQPTAPQALAPAPRIEANKIQPLTTLAQRRALVIGNDSYRHVAPLANAREDARSIAQGLTQVGYQVTLKLDLNEKDMKIALRNFKAQVEGGDEVLIFYAGHGVQIGAANYLLPIDITGESEEQIKDDGIQLQRILDDMSERKTKFTLAMIDACRDNPFKKSGRALGGRGLSPTTAATGQMVIFSAGAGQQALDKLGPGDQDKNGLFTRIFVKEMQKPGVSIDRLVRNVRNDVVNLAKSVGHEQVPAIYDQVIGEFYFRR